MRCLVATVFLLIASNLSAADEVKEEMKKLEGVWKIVNSESNGEKLENGILADGCFTIKDNSIRNEKNDARRFTIDPAKKPNRWIPKTQMAKWKCN